MLKRGPASHPNYSNYEHLLSPGWIPGRKVDNSDQQYSGFRDNIPYMFLLLIFHPLLRRAYNSFCPPDPRGGQHSQKVTQSTLDPGADARLDRRVRFDVGFACLYLLALHGTSAFKVFAILYVNFTLAKGLPKSYVPLATWVFNIGILFANEFCRGYPYVEFARISSPWIGSLNAAIDVEADRNWGTFLDSYGGLLPRWEVLFKLTILRLISFNLDYCWSLDQAGGSPLEVSELSLYGLPGACSLIAQRRSNSTQLSCQKGTGLTYPPNPKTTAFATTLHTSCIRLFTSQGPF